MKIDLTKYDKAEVLTALYNYSRPQGMGLLHYIPENMTKEEAQKLLDECPEHGKYFDYVRGRVMKVELSGDELDPCLYDHNNGKGAAERAIATIKELS